MKKFIIVILFFSLAKLHSQSIYFKTIRNAYNSNIFGEVASIQQDSLYVYLVTNSGYNSGGFCNIGNGSCYIVKVDKSTGNIVSSDSLSANPVVMKINDCVKIYNALYLGGEMAVLAKKYSFVAKYDLITKQFIWNKPFQAGAPNEVNFITQLKYFPGSDKIYFAGRNILSSPMQDLNYYTGSIDTLGNTFWCEMMMDHPMIEQLTNVKFDFATSKQTAIGIGSRIDNKQVCVFKTNDPRFIMYWDWVNNNANLLNIVSDSILFSLPAKKYTFNIVSQNNSFICMLVDTNMNVIKTKKINNLRFKSACQKNSNYIVTCLNNVSATKGTRIVNLNLDSVLNIVNSKYVLTDTFDLSSVTSATMFDKKANCFYNLISTQKAAGKKIFLYKSNFSFNSCKEGTLSVSSGTAVITSTLSAITLTGSIMADTIQIYPGSHLLVDSLVCSAFQGMDELSNSTSTISIYPNPANSSINILVKEHNYLNSKLEVKITDISGREIVSSDVDGIRPKEINLEEYKSGIYFVNIYSAGQLIRVEKVVKTD